MSVKDRILEAGEALLKEQGLAALTQPRIAKAAGCSQSHLTYYFPTRDALLLAIVEHSVDGTLHAAIARSDARLEDLLGEAMRFLPRVRMLLGLISAADADPALRAPLTRFVGNVRAALAELLHAHALPDDADSVRLVHAAVVGLAILNLGRQSEASGEDIERGLASLLKLLSAAPAAPSPQIPEQP